MFGSETIKEKIILSLRKAIKEKFGEEVLSELNFELEIPPNLEFGHFSWKCFGLAKLVKKKPEQVAEDLASFIDQLNDQIEKIVNLGGYLNFFLDKKKWFSLTITDILTKADNFGQEKIGKGKTVLIEFSEPNPNKPMHLGHLRNTLLGASIANLFKAIGYKTIRANLINDRGIHITKTMLAYKLWGENKTPESENQKPDYFVGYFYSLFNKKVEENPKLLEQAQEILKKWEGLDQETWRLWQKVNKWAMDGFQETYRKLRIEFDKWYYESETYKLGKEIVKTALNKNFCYQREDGAIEIDLTKEGFDKKVLIRADGTSIYITQDIGLAKLKHQEFKPDLSLYVVGSEQNYHFQILFKILEIFGFSWVKNYFHLSYGLVFLPEGKMKSREGKVVEIDQFIQEIKLIAKAEILKREKDILPKELEERAEKIALASIKFFFLKFNPKEDIYYFPEKEVSFEGATGPYLQYTYARIQGIIKKSLNINLDKEKELEEKKGPKQSCLLITNNIDFSSLKSNEETCLLSLLFAFPETIKKAAFSYNPSLLANYLFDLAQKFNTFYHCCPVLSSQEKIKKARLALIVAVNQVLKNGLKILGIEILDKM